MKKENPEIRRLLKTLKNACDYCRKEWIEETLLFLSLYGVTREEAFASIDE